MSRAGRFTTSTGIEPTQCSGLTTPTTLLMSMLEISPGSTTRLTSFAQSQSLECVTLSPMSSTVSVGTSSTPAASPIPSPRLWPSATSPTSWCTSPSPSDRSLQLLVASSSIPARITTSSPRQLQRISTDVSEVDAPLTTWRWCSRWPTTSCHPSTTSRSMDPVSPKTHWTSQPPPRQPRRRPSGRCSSSTPGFPTCGGSTFTTTTLGTWSSSSPTASPTTRSPTGTTGTRSGRTRPSDTPRRLRGRASASLWSLWSPCWRSHDGENDVDYDDDVTKVHSDQRNQKYWRPPETRQLKKQKWISPLLHFIWETKPLISFCSKFR